MSPAAFTTTKKDKTMKLAQIRLPGSKDGDGNAWILEASERPNIADGMFSAWVSRPIGKGEGTILGYGRGRAQSWAIANAFANALQHATSGDEADMIAALKRKYDGANVNAR